MRPLLGTFVEIGLPADFPDADKVMDLAFACVQEVQDLLNRHDPESELSQLNREKHLESMSRVGRLVLRLSRYMMRSSDGLFDCTFGSARAGRPEDIEIKGRRVRLHPDMQITLDGIAKGYAVDRALRSLRRAGVPRAYINAGGDLRVYGDLALPVWRRESSGIFQVRGHLKNAALASSQVGHENDTSFPGKIGHRGGHNAETGVWSVLAPSAWLADALTKVACLSPEMERQDRIEALGGLFLNLDTLP